MTEIEWFRRITDVPGINWRPPADVVLDQRWADARPRVHGATEDWGYIEWVDANGCPLREPDAEPDDQDADEEIGWQPTGRSPGELLAPYGLSGVALDEAVPLACSALMSPGTRLDYFDVLDRVGATLGFRHGQDARRIEWGEQFDQLAVQLLSQGTRAAVIPPLGAPDGDETRHLERARSLFIRIVQRYVREGYLLEAADMLDVMASLEEVPPLDQWTRLDPRATLAGLEELRA